MTSPFAAVEPLPDAEFSRFRRRAIFDCCKWDPQAQDVGTIARFPLILRAGEWPRLSRLAQELAREALAAEAELLARPELHARLGLPRPIRRALARVRDLGPARDAARLMRFDFHATPDGWRISEVNSDVPGGLNEASGFARLVAPLHAGSAAVGDPVETYARALLVAAPPSPLVALVHATAWSDDHQVMAYLAARLARMGARPRLASPAHLRWRDGRAELATPSGAEPVDAVARFFPAEWLTELPSSCGASRFFAGSATPLSNPAGALLTQSKRFPLAWEELSTPMATWRALLPETRDPRDLSAGERDDWVFKPALGRVGEAVAIPGLVSAKERAELDLELRRRPEEWAAQRRFDATPIDVGGDAFFPCVGAFTVDDRPAGAYGRVAPRPLIDWRAQDAAVLAQEPASVPAVSCGGVR